MNFYEIVAMKTDHKIDDLILFVGKKLREINWVRVRDNKISLVFSVEERAFFQTVENIKSARFAKSCHYDRSRCQLETMLLEAEINRFSGTPELVA